VTFHHPMVIGHRGAAGEAPENTLASFQLALEQGVQGIELDVHLSKDGEIIVCHDPTLDRTTDGTGWIYEHSSADIKRVDAGSWFGARFAGEAIPLLGEVFDLVPDTIMINVEIKSSYDGRMETALLDFLRRTNRLENVVVSSFDHKCLKRLKLLEPQAKIGLLYAANLIQHAEYARMVGVDVYSLHPHHQLLNSEDVSEAKAAGLLLILTRRIHRRILVEWSSMGFQVLLPTFPQD
jgi:glycerophosphoryl diester phosphodiesterase